MGTSCKEGKAWTKEKILELGDEIKTVLDVGAGCGTYADLLDFIPREKKVAIEAFRDYIEEYNLRDKYLSVINADVRHVRLGRSFDLVILGDILEHMTKDEAVRVFDMCRTLSKWVLISVPIIKYPQGAINDNPFEVHVKEDWSNEEVLDTFGIAEKMFIGDIVGVYLMKGAIK